MDQAIQCCYSDFVADVASIAWKSYQVLRLNVADERSPLPAIRSADETPVEAHIQVFPLFDLLHPLLSWEAGSLTLCVCGLAILLRGPRTAHGLQLLLQHLKHLAGSLSCQIIQQQCRLMI